MPQPGRERDVDEVTRDEQQRLEVDRFRQLDGADRVHPEGEDHAPVQRVVHERKMLVQVPPDAEYEEQRNPPSARRPEEQSKPFKERRDLAEKAPAGGVNNQPRPRERRNGDRPHVNPVGRRERHGSEVDEREAVKDERDEYQIEHAAQEKHAEREEKQKLADRTEL